MRNNDDDMEEEEEEEEKQPEKPGIDYDELDPDNGFKKIDWKIWQSYNDAVLSKPEDERDDPDEWADTFAQENNIDKNRILTALKLGIYAGSRDDFHQRTGEGKTIYSNGDTYEGQFWEGKKNGKGKYVYKSQGMSEVDKLLSELKKTKTNDESMDEYIERAMKTASIGEEIVKAVLEYGYYPCYNGDYINNLRHGKGVMKNKDGSVYKGDWKDNKRHGDGIYYYLNGDNFSGQWEEGLKHGYGCYTFNESKVQYVGIWEKGIFKEGQWVMSDGHIYEGKFDSKNRPCDPKGAIKFGSLNMVQQGEYKKGKWSPTNVLYSFEEYEKAIAPIEEATQPV